MTTTPEFTQRLCIDGPHEGTFVRMRSHNPGATVTFPNGVVYQLQEDNSLQHVADDA